MQMAQPRAGIIKFGFYNSACSFSYVRIYVKLQLKKKKNLQSSDCFLYNQNENLQTS